MIEVRALKPDGAEAASVVLAGGAVRFHAGIAYRAATGDLRILHLAGHCRVRVLAPEGGWAEIVPALDLIDQQIIAAHCVTLAEARPEVPYGLKAEGHFLEDGRFVPGRSGTGLTCASFVQKVFEWCRCPLVDESSWTYRDDDVSAQEALIAHLEEQAADPTHVAAVRVNRCCVRVRPEEVAAAAPLPADR